MTPIQNLTLVNTAVERNLLCTHALTGRAPLTKMCGNGYDCGSCPFDQMLDDLAEGHRERKEAPRLRIRAA